MSLFNSKTPKEKSPVSTSVSTASVGGLNSLVHGTKITGEIHADSDIRVDGKLNGKLICKSKVIIGPTGHIDGSIQCENALIEGTFDGNLSVSGLLHIKENAKVSGDIRTNKLIVAPGAIFNVSCNMSNKSGASNGQVNKKTNKVSS